jgi:hypothetical protein
LAADNINQIQSEFKGNNFSPSQNVRCKYPRTAELLSNAVQILASLCCSIPPSLARGFHFLFHRRLLHLQVSQPQLDRGRGKRRKWI